MSTFTIKTMAQIAPKGGRPRTWGPGKQTQIRCPIRLKALLTDIGKALSHGDKDAAIALIRKSDLEALGLEIKIEKPTRAAPP